MKTTLDRRLQAAAERVIRQVEHELGVVERLNFPAYFLTVNDLVRFARRRGIGDTLVEASIGFARETNLCPPRLRLRRDSDPYRLR